MFHSDYKPNFLCLNLLIKVFDIFFFSFSMKVFMKFTLAIIKPDAVKNCYEYLILDQIRYSGFKIRALKMMMFSKKDAQEFYSVHKYKSFFDSLVEFMSNHPIIAAVLEKNKAVSDFRLLIGDTNFKKAKEGTIRKSYAKSLKRNAIHGSDSDVSAFREINFCFFDLSFSYEKSIFRLKIFFRWYSSDTKKNEIVS